MHDDQYLKENRDIYTPLPDAHAKVVLAKGDIYNKIDETFEKFKNLKIEIKGLLGVDKAIITSGGVDLKEVDFKTMRSRKFPNLFLIGDILNIDRPSGGYSLQLCWTTGAIAGKEA